MISNVRNDLNILINNCKVLREEHQCGSIQNPCLNFRHELMALRLECEQEDNPSKSSSKMIKDTLCY